MKYIVATVALICVLIVAVPHTTSAASFTTSANAAPTTVPRGTTLTIDVLVKSDTAMNLLIDLEVYRPDGQRAFPQQVWDNQAFAAGQQRTFRATWAVPTDAALGTYTSKVGLFSPGWGPLQHWNDNAGQFSVSSSAPATGTGLTGQYYDNKDLTNLKLTRTDATVDFDWGSSAPSGALGADTFSVRWQGQVQPRYSETYTFYTSSNDGVRLWVNGKRLVNSWTNRSTAAEKSGTIALTAGQKYDLKLEYYDNTGVAVSKLSWSSASQPKQIVPQSQLYPSAQATPTATPVPTVIPTATPVPTATPTATPGAGRYFSTLPPGSPLPSDAECAAAVKRRAENKGVNATYNATRGNQRLASDFFGGSDPRANSQLAPRVSGNFAGTTDEILQWAACKWGIDEDMVRAQAAIESWWRQTTKGDWTTDASRCAPGHGLGVDGRPGECPESWGILQNRYPYEQSAWPGIADSTAFNADTAYAIWRACYEGYEWWLNDVEHGQPYAAGDAWGCVGRWFAGRWHTPPAEEYTNRVRGYLNERIWEQPSFQEP